MKSVTLGAVLAEVVVPLPDGQEIVSASTRASAESMSDVQKEIGQTPDARPLHGGL